MNAYVWNADHWHWPQYAALFVLGLNLVSYAVMDGKPRAGEYNFALQLVSAAFSFWMLLAGGLFA